MKNGRPSWTSKASRPVLERIQAAIAGGDEQRVIYARFNISQYGCSPRTFRRYADWYRREWQDRQPTPEPTPGTALDLLEQVTDAIQDSLSAGRLKDGKLPEVLNSLVKLARLQQLEEDGRRKDERLAQLADANKRAQEQHELKIADMRKALKAAVETKTESGAKPITREDVYDMIDSVMRGTA